MILVIICLLIICFILWLLIEIRFYDATEHIEADEKRERKREEQRVLDMNYEYYELTGHW